MTTYEIMRDWLSLKPEQVGAWIASHPKEYALVNQVEALRKESDG